MKIFNKLSWPKLTVKKILLLSLVLLVTALLLYFLRANNTPNEAKIKVASTESEVASSTRYLPLSSSFFNLLYPDKFTLLADQPSPNYLAKYIGKGSIPSQSLEITIKPAPYGGIVLDSDYKTYQNQQDKYKFGQKFYGQEPVVLVTNKADGETIGIWLHGKYIMVIKMKDNITPKELDAQIKDVFSSVQWQIQ